MLIVSVNGTSCLGMNKEQLRSLMDTNDVHMVLRKPHDTSKQKGRASSTAAAATAAAGAATEPYAHEPSAIDPFVSAPPNALRRSGTHDKRASARASVFEWAGQLPGDVLPEPSAARGTQDPAPRTSTSNVGSLAAAPPPNALHRQGSTQSSDVIPSVTRVMRGSVPPLPEQSSPARPSSTEYMPSVTPGKRGVHIPTAGDTDTNVDGLTPFQREFGSASERSASPSGRSPSSLADVEPRAPTQTTGSLSPIRRQPPPSVRDPIFSSSHALNALVKGARRDSHVSIHNEEALV
jgi:hypothetical protein